MKKNVLKKIPVPKYLILILVFDFHFLIIQSQSYPPGVGFPGTTAIYKDSSVFANWATACQVIRGLQDVSTPSLGLATAGDSSMVYGKADGIPVSLGDGGSAVCTFANPITDGPGYDFAVFENSFDGSFLELAFVEVSSDGKNFVRFKSHSLSDTTIQTSSFGNTNPTKINNLAGKYQVNYGTPFDLNELAMFSSVQINKITHIRIVDVVGSIQKQFATRDGYGNKVNDPFPTPFPSGGFDLDAIGVIHELKIISVSELKEKEISVFPNPLNGEKFISINTNENFPFIELSDMSGRKLKNFTEKKISLKDFENGIYFLKIITEEKIYFQKIILSD